MPLILAENDITKMNVDAIVNPANPTLLGGGGLDGEIHKAAGTKLLEECRRLGGCKTGEAKITKGYDLPAKYIIHTVGPIWQGGSGNERELLCECYRNALALALKKRCRTVAVPIISAGAYGYPIAEATEIAKREILRFLDEYDGITVYLLKRRDTMPEKGRLYSQIEYYMMQNGISGTDDIPKSLFTVSDRNVVDKCECSAPCTEVESLFAEEERVDGCICEDSDYPMQQSPVRKSRSAKVWGSSAPSIIGSALPKMAKASSAKASSLEEMLDSLDMSFSETLLQLIDASGMSDAECYKRANIDRKLFSKIRSNKNYKPSKSTVLAFAIALRLNLDDTRMLLERAGFALSPSSKFDVIIQFFITNGNYDIYEINDALFAFDQNLLGAS